MLRFTYLFIICFSLAGLALADWRYNLALRGDWRRTLRLVGSLVIFFLLWDIAGVEAGIFFIGDSALLTGYRLLPEVPIEEVFFLILMVYVTLLTWRWFDKKHPNRGAPS